MSAAEDIARAFVSARTDWVALRDYPGEMPQSLDQAYRIQEQAIRLFDKPIAGWKVGRIAEPLVVTFGTNRLTGPVFADGVVRTEDAAQAPEMPIFAGGFAAAEAEYLLHLASLPDRFDREWTNAAMGAYVDEIRIGIEIAGSPFPGINAHGPAVTASDFGNNTGLVIGPTIDRASDFHDWPVSLSIDGAIAGQATARAMLDGPFGAVRFLFELARDRGLPLAAGQWISTGAVTGIHPVRDGAWVEARFGDIRVQCRINGKSRA